TPAFFPIFIIHRPCCIYRPFCWQYLLGEKPPSDKLSVHRSAGRRGIYGTASIPPPREVTGPTQAGQRSGAEAGFPDLVLGAAGEPGGTVRDPRAAQER